MSYENAAGTKMLATHCAACGRPLLDAKSVETGMGPICRDKFGFDADVSEENRRAANQIVYQIALVQTGFAAAIGAAMLKEIGFAVLAKRILQRVIKIQIETKGTEYVVRIPYSEENVNAMRTVPGVYWDRDSKANRVPMKNQKALQTMLERSFKGETAIGPKGLFVVGEK